MFYKKSCKVFLYCFFVVFLSTLSVYIVIDPLDMWSVAELKGINNYKSAQPANLDLFKPYQYINNKPDVVFMGTSRVYVGVPPYCAGNNETKVYNMGFSSLTLQDAYEYILFMNSVHKPKIIYLGLDFFQFDKKYAKASRSGFSSERLHKLSLNEVEAFLYKVHETLGLRKMLRKTVTESREHSNEPPLFIDGWDVKRGNSKSLNTEEFPRTMQELFDAYRYWELDESALDTLQDIVKLAEKSDVELIVFFNPIMADHLAVKDICGKQQDFEMVKERVAHITPVWDFAFVNEMTANRDLFYEASHYRGEFGEKILKVMINKQNFNEQIGVLLTTENILSELAIQKQEYEIWKDKHFDYFALLESSYKYNKKLTYDEMKN